tara:strand:- start:1919 stop:3070 length:1152 start_codon:yes stop_codon:yes gene_type:complete
MATNFHSDLPNDQIHEPKDFSIAENSSVPVRNNIGLLEWVASPFNMSTTISCGADVAGVLHNSFFHIFYNTTTFLEVHFSVTGDSAAFTPTVGFTQEAVIISPNATAIDVALAIKTQLDTVSSRGAISFVTSVNGTGKVTFSGMSNTVGTIDKGTGFVYANTRTPYGTQNLVSINGDVQWETQAGGGAVTSLTTTGITGASTLVSGVLNVPNYVDTNTTILSRNIEAYGSISSGTEYGMNNAQYNSEHKFSVNLGAPLITTITPKNMVTTSVWCSPNASTLKGWNGWIWGVNGQQVVLSLLRVKLNCPAPTPGPSTTPVCRTSSITITMAGNNNPVCWNETSFTECAGWLDNLGVNEMIVLTAHCASGTASAQFNLNCNILLQ